MLKEKLLRKQKLLEERNGEGVEEKEEEGGEKIKIEEMSSEGELTIGFTQKMLAPADPSLVDYKNVFDVFMISAITGEKVSGVSHSRRVLVAQNSVIWEVTKHSADQLVINLSFSHPELVSSSVYGRDTLVVKIVNLSPFISAETGEPLIIADFPSGLPQITKELPPIVD